MPPKRRNRRRALKNKPWVIVWASVPAAVLACWWILGGVSSWVGIPKRLEVLEGNYGVMSKRVDTLTFDLQSFRSEASSTSKRQSEDLGELIKGQRDISAVINVMQRDASVSARDSISYGEKIKSLQVAVDSLIQTKMEATK